jgi:hypothetical protein
MFADVLFIIDDLFRGGLTQQFALVCAHPVPE